MRLMDTVRNKPVIAVLIVITTLTGWIGYEMWHRSSQTVSEWRSADEEMVKLLAQQAEARQNKPNGKGASAGPAKEDQEAKATEEIMEGKPPSQAITAGPSPQADEQPVAGGGQAAGINETKQKAPQKDNTKSESAGKLDLNKATADQLTTLPGIGESKANAIIAYREQAGGRFKSVDQLLNVKGIGEKVLAKIKPHLSVEP